MTNRMQTGIMLSALVLGLSGCSGSNSSSTSPSIRPPVSTQPSFLPPAPGYLIEVTLSGVVSEETLNGRAPIEGVWVYCEPCGAETHSGMYTDSNGFYSFLGVWTDRGRFPTRLWVSKEGYADPEGLPTPTYPYPGPGWREVVVNGDTRLDVQLVRR